MKRYIKHLPALKFFLVSICLWLPGVVLSQGASPVMSEEERASRQLIHEAALAVDGAWEEFHQAAIGGTLSSPASQTRIEGQLHQARALLMDARKAERNRDHHSVKIITSELFVLSNEIVQASRERKR